MAIILDFVAASEYNRMSRCFCLGRAILGAILRTKPPAEGIQSRDAPIARGISGKIVWCMVADGGPSEPPGNFCLRKGHAAG